MTLLPVVEQLQHCATELKLAAEVFLKMLPHSFCYTTGCYEKQTRIKLYLENLYELFNVMVVVPAP